MFYLDLFRELQKHEVQYLVVSFETMYRNRIEKDVGGVQLKVASIDDLIALKTDTGRKQDASDIAALNQVKQIAPERE